MRRMKAYARHVVAVLLVAFVCAAMPSRALAVTPGEDVAVVCGVDESGQSICVAQNNGGWIYIAYLVVLVHWVFYEWLFSDPSAPICTNCSDNVVANGTVIT